MNKDTWHQKILDKHSKEILKSALFIMLVVLVTTLWGFVPGKTFEWQSIEPIGEPSIFVRLFYSALVFTTFGAFLYQVGFYKFLYSLYRGTKNGWREYQKMKAGIWGLLTLLMFFVIVPFVVDVLNNFISFLFNMYKLLLYIFPSIIISLTIIVVIYFVRRKLNVM